MNNKRRWAIIESPQWDGIGEFSHMEYVLWDTQSSEQYALCSMDDAEALRLKFEALEALTQPS